MDDDNVPAELSSGRSHFPAGSVQASPVQHQNASVFNEQLAVDAFIAFYGRRQRWLHTNANVLALQLLTISLLQEVTSAVDEIRADWMCGA